MKVVILAGGLGSRLIEKTNIIPKPMVEIGTKPIIWHIMKYFSHYGHNEFIICLGYKGEIIKDYFTSYYSNNSDLTLDLGTNNYEMHNQHNENWKISLIDTGEETLTGARIAKIKKYTEGNRFFLTYGDGLADINLNSLLKHHINSGKKCTVSAVKPEGRFGVIKFLENQISFSEKNIKDVDWVNGGFFICEQSIFKYVDENDNVMWEKSPMENLANDNELNAYQHSGFWKPMDTLKDQNILNNLWFDNKAKWKKW
jgi:glucose-1-phosphate cytidylyltransferase